MARSPILALTLVALFSSSPTLLSAQEPQAAYRAFGEPHAFVLNRGQWSTQVLFQSQKGPTTSWFQRDGWIFALQQSKAGDETATTVAVRMTFQNASSQTSRPNPRGEDELPGHYNFFLGDEPSTWESEVPAYGRIRYPGLQEGVDVVVREGQGLFEYDIHLAPGADLSKVVIRCEGILGLTIDDQDGSLIMQTALGPVVQKAPATWHVLPNGARKPVTCSYRKISADRYGFQVSGRIQNLPLVIDPDLTWSTFFGGGPTGTGDTQIFSIAKQPRSTGPNAWVTFAGRTNSASLPTTTGSYQAKLGGSQDAFVTQLDPSKTGAAQLRWVTYVGGSGFDEALGVAVDLQGNVTLAGATLSTNFPVSSTAFQKANNGAIEAFATRLDNAGAKLLWSTYLGGTGNDWACAVSVDVTMQATVAGYSDSVGSASTTPFPTTANAFQRTIAGGRDAFVTRVSALGTGLSYSTLLGGSGQEGLLPNNYQTNPTFFRVMGMDQTLTGRIAVTGITASTNLPTTNKFPLASTTKNPVYQASMGGASDVFVALIDPRQPAATQLLYSTYLGSTLREGGMAVDLASGDVMTVGGYTYSGGFPTTTGAYDTSINTQTWHDVFVTQLDPHQTTVAGQLRYSTFMGGSSFDSITALEVDRRGVIDFTGYCNAGFPTTPGAISTKFGGVQDVFVARIAPRGKGSADLLYSTYLGGSGFERPFGLALDGIGGVFVAGGSLSSNFPTQGAYSSTKKGRRDGFVVHLWGLNEGVTRVGNSTPVLACTAKLHAGAAGAPVKGSKTFAVYACGAQPAAAGFLVVGLTTAKPPIALGSVLVYTLPLILLGIKANGAGNYQLLTGIPAGTVKGLKVVVQFAFAHTTCGLTATNGLRLTVQ